MQIKEEVIETLIIEKSKFIAYLKPCFSMEEYKEYLKEIKKKHYDATHVCSALITDSQKKSSDYGEPSGTAGIPILSTLEKNNLTNTCALVVRYFGGIKLGAGGLVRAYSESVSNALKKAKFTKTVIYPKYSLRINYELNDKINNYLRNNATILNTEYNENVIYIFLSDNKNLFEDINQITKGISPQLLGEEKVEVDI